MESHHHRTSDAAVELLRSWRKCVGAMILSMPKHKDPLLVALERGELFTWTLPEGGDLASMRATLKHGQTLIIELGHRRNRSRDC